MTNSTCERSSDKKIKRVQYATATFYCTVKYNY